MEDRHPPRSHDHMRDQKSTSIASDRNSARFPREGHTERLKVFDYLFIRTKSATQRSTLRTKASAQVREKFELSGSPAPLPSSETYADAAPSTRLEGRAGGVHISVDRRLRIGSRLSTSTNHSAGTFVRAGPGCSGTRCSLSTAIAHSQKASAQGPGRCPRP